MVSKNIITTTHFEPQQFGNDWGLFVDIDIDNYQNNNKVVSNICSTKTITTNIYKNLYIASDVYEKCYINNFTCINYYHVNDENTQTYSNIFDYLNDKNNVYEIAGYLTITLVTSCLTYGMLCIL